MQHQKRSSEKQGFEFVFGSQGFEFGRSACRYNVVVKPVVVLNDFFRSSEEAKSDVIGINPGLPLYTFPVSSYTLTVPLYQPAVELPQIGEPVSRSHTPASGFLRRHGSLDVILHGPPPAVEGPSAELIHQVFPDRSSGDGSQNGFSGLSASTDVTGEQDGVGEDLLSQVRTLQDSAPGLLGCLEFAFELLDPLVPLSQGLLEGRHLSTVHFVPVFGPGEEIGNGVGHLQDYELAVEVDNANTE
nr:hypothetical protein Iba_chr04fCG6250 [Ipomoea batatas]